MTNTWEDIVLDVQSYVDDEDGVFHPMDIIRTYLEDAELFVSLSRFLVEKTVTFPLLANVAEYTMTDTYADWCWPLRLTSNGAPVTEVKLESVARTRPAWRQERGTPEHYIRLGHTMLAFLPVPNINMSVEMTHLAVPRTQLSDPPAGAGPMIQNMWHSELMTYATMMATAKEGQMGRTQDLLKDVAEHVGSKRDVRFLRDTSQRGAKTRWESPLTKSDERP